MTIDKNVISENLANDDGGGIRLLQVSGSHISRATPGTVTISNNTVTENISTHEGGGIALDDAAFVDIVGNTVAENLTTASAVTVCLSDVFTCGRRGFFSNSATWEPQ